MKETAELVGICIGLGLLMLGGIFLIVVFYGAILGTFLGAAYLFIKAIVGIFA